MFHGNQTFFLIVGNVDDDALSDLKIRLSVDSEAEYTSWRNGE